MFKTTFITNITPLPPHISRDQAIGLLHDHSSMIKLNPLVLRYGKCDPHTNATPEEAEKCMWYEIVDEISYLPGGWMKSEIAYKGGFYDHPQGLQTHVFAPAGVDLKAFWKVCGSMPGEPPEPRELGTELPREGLYIREDVELGCNMFMIGFIKRNLKKSHPVMVERLLASIPQPKSSQTSDTYGHALSVTARDSSSSAHRSSPSFTNGVQGQYAATSANQAHLQPHAIDRPYRSPQLYGEQAELSSHPQSVHPESNWPDGPPKARPMPPRDAAGGAVLELDDSEVKY